MLLSRRVLTIAIVYCMVCQHCIFISYSIQLMQWPGHGGGEDSYIKQTGMLVVSLRSANFRFWSRLGCSGQSDNILSRQGLVQGFAKKQNFAKRNRSQIFFFLRFFSFLSGLFQGSKFAKATPRWSPLGVKFKISDEHPRLFHMGVPPRGLGSFVQLHITQPHHTIIA